MQGTINITDLPAGGEIRSTDLFPAVRLDGLVYKVSIATGLVVLFAGENLLQGDAVTILSNGTVVKAKADSILTANVLGFVANDVVLGDEVSFYDVYVTTPQTLTVGAQYYLSDITSGVLVNNAPVTSGNYVVPVGTAVTTNILKANIALAQLIP